MESAIHERPVRARPDHPPPPRAFRPGSAMPEKAGAPGYGKVPPRIAAINDRKAVGGKISSRSVWKSNLQLDFNVRVIERFGPDSSAALQELDESNRFVQKSAESTSIWPR